MGTRALEDTSAVPDEFYAIGVDIGGTFTDCVVVDHDGTVVTGKAPTTPADLSIGFFDSVAAAAEKVGQSLERLLAQATVLNHGTTVGINALVTGQTAKVVLVTTAGHADAIVIMNDRGGSLGASITELLDKANRTPPEPIIPPERVIEIHERMDSLGDEVVALREEELARVAAAVGEADPEAVAVCLLWSFANSAHEVEVKRYLEEQYPDLPVSCSHEVAPRIGVYPRAVTTIMNASLAPLMTEYVENIANRAQSLGFSGEVMFVQNDGGLVPAVETKRFPIITMRSGPVAGVVGTAVVSEWFGDSNILVADMGGTTFDVGVICNRKASHRNDDIVERHLIHSRVVNVESIGAGGGSIAWVDEQTGGLRVGPRSAGARPGPICYGRGGTEVTVTDADLVLGILNAERPLPGGVKLDYEAAADGVRVLAEKLDLDPIECAAGIVEVVDSNMEDLVRRITVQQGQDPRDFSLWAYGGASGAHAGLFSRQLHVKRVVFPLGDTASVWSALGCTLLRQRREFPSSVFLLPPWDLDLIAQWLERLDRRAIAYAGRAGMEEGSYRLVRSANLKYGLQVHEVETVLPEGPIDEAWMRAVIADFEQAYERQFGAGTAYSGTGVTMTALRVVVESLVAGTGPQTVSVGDRHDDTIPDGARPVFWRELGDWSETPIFAGPRLEPESRLDGPAIIEYPHTTLVARPGQSLWVEASGNVVLDLGMAAFGEPVDLSADVLLTAEKES
jgi:N-methylhydantoinase A